MERTTGTLPPAAIILATTWLHLRRIDVALDQGITNVAENLQVVNRIGSAMILRDSVIDMQRAVIGATANSAAMIVFGHYYFAGRFVSDLGHRLVPSVSITII